MIETIDLVWHPRGAPARRVLDGVTLSVPAGSVTALLGRNGSGKTTLLRVLAGVLSPRSGVARVAGEDVARRPAAARAGVGFLPEENGIPDRATPLWHLRFHALLRGASRQSADRIALTALAVVGLETSARVPMGTMSRGNRQRVAIARAMLCSPKVLLLDEPGAALDPAVAAVVGGLLRRRVCEGGTVLVATHDPVWAGRWCDASVEMAGGRNAQDAAGETPGGETP